MHLVAESLEEYIFIEMKVCSPSNIPFSFTHLIDIVLCNYILNVDILSFFLSYSVREIHKYILDCKVIQLKIITYDIHLKYQRN